MGPNSSVRRPRGAADRFQVQERLIEECVRSGDDLYKRLEAEGWSYDDLVYKQRAKVASRRIKPLALEDFPATASGIPMVSFFSGAGGLDLGFEALGFEHLALVEKVELFCDTLRFNRPEWNVLGPPVSHGDVSEIEALSEELDALLGSKPFEGVFAGGPPCQPFSIAANQRFSRNGRNFKRVGFEHEVNGNLLSDYADLICRFLPSAFLIENVPGLLEIDGGVQMRRVIEKLTSAGYRVHEPMIMNAADYGVPQNRNRLILVGSRTNREFRAPIAQSEPASALSAIDPNLTGVSSHVTRKHSATSVSRYMTLGVGQRDQRGRVDRLHPDLPSKTVIAGGTSGGGRSHLHPMIPRTLSVRESARLQTFPDTYKFVGSAARQFTQVGNAVPPVLAAKLAEAIATCYFDR